jgi:uncharacterized membrane protein YhaH (DUF805 family)
MDVSRNGPRSFTGAIVICLTGYFDFRERAPRSEYWFFALFNVLVSIVADILDAVTFHASTSVGVFSIVVGLGLIIPSIAVGVRRLHDIDRTGWWLLLDFIPIIGWIVLLIWACMAGTSGPNRFGPDPLGQPA